MFATHFFKTIHAFDEFVYRWDHNIVPHYDELMEMIENPQWYSINEIVSKANQYAELAQNYYNDARALWVVTTSIIHVRKYMKTLMPLTGS